MSKRPPPKRSSGRPPIVRPVEPINGIISEPSDPSNIVELIYNFPQNIKYIWHLFKNMRSERNYMTFYPDSIVIFCKANHGKSRVKCAIDCKFVTSYFCAKTHTITVDCNEFANMTRRIDSKFKNIQIQCQKDNNHSITIILDPGNGMRENHVLNLTDEYDEDDFIDQNFCTTSHVIEIKMVWQYFKKMITEIKKNVQLIAFIQEHYSSPVIMSYQTAEGRTSVRYEFERQKEDNLKENKISFVSHLPEASIFHSTIRMEYLRPFITNMPNKFINMYIDEINPLRMHLLTCDNAIDLTVLIDIEHGN